VNSGPWEAWPSRPIPVEALTMPAAEISQFGGRLASFDKPRAAMTLKGQARTDYMRR
jgi:hypothetical protein